MLSTDGKRLRMVAQNGGVVEGTALNVDSFELFYFENKGGVSVAATNVLTRQKWAARPVHRKTANRPDNDTMM